MSIELALAAIGIWLATAALLVAAQAHCRDDDQDERLDVLERDGEAGPEQDAPATEGEPPRAPIGFRRE